MTSSSSTVKFSQRQQQHNIPPPSSSTSSRSNNLSVRSSKVPSSSRRSVTPTSRAHSRDHEPESGRVRVSVRLRPRNAEDLLLDADFADCVELQPELKRLKLRKNNWNSESYRFDEVFIESASQKRVYDVVAKPVVEVVIHLIEVCLQQNDSVQSVLNGYNGTVMAYGQTGTGKTYTLGRLGKDDASERGIMVRALEDILANTSPASDSVEISYLQLYMESVQDLLAPEKINIPIFDDSRSGEVSVPGAAVVKVQHLDHFLEILQIGETNRHAANSKMNTESSRSHAILMVYVRRHAHEKEETEFSLQVNNSGRDLLTAGNGIPTVQKSKLLIVDLAGSERLDKSGSEGHLAEETKFINLSLTSLGKCINALAENSPHIPTRDSKLTRLLRDSFGVKFVILKRLQWHLVPELSAYCSYWESEYLNGNSLEFNETGSARTSLIITIGPSSRHHAETTSTIMFGQRAMKVVNMVKLKEEFDYESLCRKLENQVDHLTAEIDRQQKLWENDNIEMERKLKECNKSFAEEGRSLVARCEFVEKENTHLEAKMTDILMELKHQKDHNDLMCNEVAQLEKSLKRSEVFEAD
ncbi:hypothetical protein LguiA_016774 [Lonicera macranthoides]